MKKVSKKIILENVRCSYVFVDQPRDQKDDDGNVTGKNYSIQPLIKKKSKLAKKLQKLQEQIAKEAFGEKVKLGMLKMPLRDGDEEREGEEYEKHFFMNANGNRKPGIVNPQGEKADQDDIEELCYSGAYFHVSVNLYAFERKGNKGVAVGLNNVMLVKEGERLDGATNATSEFADYAKDSDDDDGDDDWD